MINSQMKLGVKSASRFAGFGSLVLFLCWQHVQATRLGYLVESARKDALSRRGRVAAITLELDQRLSPEHVALRAAKMGLVPASPDALRLLPENRLPTANTWTFARLWGRGIISRS
jgi:hypothetical protein